VVIMVYRTPPFSANLVFFEKKVIPGYEQAGYLEARKFAKERGMKIASHKVLEEHIQRCPGYGPIWERELMAYPEAGKVLRVNRDVTDVHGWTLPGSYVPQEADRVPNVALVIDPAEIEEHRERIIVHPHKIAILWDFPQNPQGDDYRMPLDFFSDSAFAGRCLVRYWGGGVRPMIRRIYGGMKNLSVDYSPSAPFAIAVEVPLS
jgi:hypothetical protein